MKKYIDKPIGSIPHVCASCQDVQRFNSKHVYVDQHDWRFRKFRVPYGYVIECEECGSRQHCRGSFLERTDTSSNEPKDLYSALLELRGEEDNLVLLANAYRNASVGMVDDEASWRLILYAMDFLHTELHTPKQNEFIRTTTTLSRISIWLLGLFSIMILTSMLLLALTDFAGIPDDGFVASAVIVLGMLLPVIWTIYSLITLCREYLSKIRKQRMVKQMPNRLAGMLRGLIVDGPTLERAFDLGKEYGLAPSMLNPLDVLSEMSRECDTVS